MNKVLVIGRGGREHALAWKFSKSPSVQEVFVAPGNKGMEDVATIVDIDENDFDGLIKFAKDENITLTFVGPESPLVNGVVDLFTKEGLTIFGPNKKAAMLEGSKSFAKDLMEKYNIPTAKHKCFDDYEKAKEYLQNSQMPIVLKADGLAAGKGVVVAITLEEALSAIDEMLIGQKFGQAASTVIIEEFLQGEEFTYLAFVNGQNVYPMIISQDHKRAYDDDLGPNTGGMGAYSPVPQIDKDMCNKALNDILKATANAMVSEGTPFVGILYAGLISTSTGPKVIEFNVRFGDPEAEVILPLLESDLFEVVMEILNSSQDKNIELKWINKAIVGIVIASEGYPNAYKTGIPIEGIENLQKSTYVFHCGTDIRDKELVTSGGRVMLIAKKGDTLREARDQVYKELKKLVSNGVFYRKDIGRRGIEVEEKLGFVPSLNLYLGNDDDDD